MMAVDLVTSSRINYIFFVILQVLRWMNLHVGDIFVLVLTNAGILMHYLMV